MKPHFTSIAVLLPGDQQPRRQRRPNALPELPGALHTVRRLLAPALSGLALTGFLSPAWSAPNKPNVLFIAVDDLNHWVGYLGRNRQTVTPNLDRLARRGVWFTRSYCAAPICNPPRAALMSGLRPALQAFMTTARTSRPPYPQPLP